MFVVSKGKEASQNMTKIPKIIKKKPENNKPRQK